MKKMLFIMNPYSGMRRASRYLSDIIGLFNRHGYEVITHMTGAQGEAIDVVAQTANRVDLVVCCVAAWIFPSVIFPPAPPTISPPV